MNSENEKGAEQCHLPTPKDSKPRDEIIPNVVYEENSEENKLRDALLVVEKAKGGHCPYCKPKRPKFLPVKLADCKRLWDHGEQLSACITLVGKEQHRLHMAANEKMQKINETMQKMLGIK